METSTHPEDVLVIEGHPTLHPQFAGMTIYATQVATKLQQQAKRQQREVTRST